MARNNKNLLELELLMILKYLFLSIMFKFQNTKKIIKFQQLCCYLMLN